MPSKRYKIEKSSFLSRRTTSSAVGFCDLKISQQNESIILSSLFLFSSLIVKLFIFSTETGQRHQTKCQPPTWMHIYLQSWGHCDTSCAQLSYSAEAICFSPDLPQTKTGQSWDPRPIWTVYTGRLHYPSSVRLICGFLAFQMTSFIQ